MIELKLLRKCVANYFVMHLWNTLAHCCEETAHCKLYHQHQKQLVQYPFQLLLFYSFLYGVKVVFRHTILPTQQLALMLKMEVCRVWLFDKFLSDSRRNCQGKFTTVCIDVWVLLYTDPCHLCFLVGTSFSVLNYFFIFCRVQVCNFDIKVISNSFESSKTPEVMPDKRHCLLGVEALSIQWLNWTPTHLAFT